jgi:hypothetical protein
MTLVAYMPDLHRLITGNVGGEGITAGSVDHSKLVMQMAQVDDSFLLLCECH